MALASESLRVAADLASLKPATEFVRRGAAEAGFSSERIGVLDLVFEELFVNIASYAYPAGETGAVDITWSLPEPAVLAVELADCGKPFDPFSLPDPELADTLELRPVGGLGVFLVRQMTQSQDYCRESGRNLTRFRITAGPDA